jgi:hypothetical protein
MIDYNYLNSIPMKEVESISETSVLIYHNTDRLYGLVFGVPGYNSRGPEYDFRRYQSFWVVAGLERGTLNLMKLSKALLEWKSSGYSPEIRY